MMKKPLQRKPLKKRHIKQSKFVFKLTKTHFIVGALIIVVALILSTVLRDLYQARSRNQTRNISASPTPSPSSPPSSTSEVASLFPTPTPLPSPTSLIHTGTFKSPLGFSYTKKLTYRIEEKALNFALDGDDIWAPTRKESPATDIESDYFHLYVTKMSAVASLTKEDAKKICRIDPMTCHYSTYFDYLKQTYVLEGDSTSVAGYSDYKTYVAAELSEVERIARGELSVEESNFFKPNTELVGQVPRVLMEPYTVGKLFGLKYVRIGNTTGDSHQYSSIEYLLFSPNKEYIFHLSTSLEDCPEIKKTHEKMESTSTIEAYRRALKSVIPSCESSSEKNTIAKNFLTNLDF